MLRMQQTNQQKNKHLSGKYAEFHLAVELHVVLSYISAKVSRQASLQDLKTNVFGPFSLYRNKPVHDVLLLHIHPILNAYQK